MTPKPWTWRNLERLEQLNSGKDGGIETRKESVTTSPIVLTSDFRKVEFSAYRSLPPITTTLGKRLRGISWRYYVAGLISISAITALAGLSSWANIWLAFNVSKLVLVPLALLWAWARFHTAPMSLRRMIEIPPVQVQYPVRISCNDWHGCVISRDEGIITFADGHLLFEGRRFNLALDPGFLRQGENGTGS